MKKRYLLTLLGVALGVLLLGLVAFGQVTYDAEWHTVDGGGGVSTGNMFTVRGTAGQPDAGISSGMTYTVRGGFWPGASVPPNQPPVADAGFDQGVNTDVIVSLDGSGSSDPDGNLPLTYNWTQTGGPSVTFDDALSVTTFSAPGDPTILTFSLSVTDSLDLADPTPDEVAVAVNNQAPVADAGGDQSVDTNTLVTLNGSGSSDPDGDLPLTYGWMQTGGPAVALSNPAVVAPTFTAPGDPGVLTFTLAVTDALGLASTPDEVVITVNNQTPVADAGGDQSVDTNALVTLDGSGSSDPDGDLPLTYLWTQTSGPAVTLSNPAVVAPTFTAPDDPAVLTFTLVVTDSLGLPDPTPDQVVITVEGYRIYLPLVVRQAPSGAEVITPPGLAWSRRPSWRFQRALPAEAAVIE